MHTKQIDFWKGDFGKEYTDRNIFQTIEEFENLYFEWYGITKTALDEKFLGFLDKENTKILEVGCNLGYQLRSLQAIGFKQLYGIELQEYAIEKARKIHQNISIIQGSGFDIPFKDTFFDVTFTSGVLIHIAPENISFYERGSALFKKIYLGIRVLQRNTQRSKL